MTACCKKWRIVMEYTLELLGQSYALRVPYELEISKSFIPFLRSGKTKNPQHLICVTLGKVLQPNDDMKWHDSYYFGIADQRHLILHCDWKDRTPYCSVEFLPDGNVDITVRPEFVLQVRSANGLFRHIGFENLLLRFGGLILHSSFIAKSGKGILFSAPSGTGKSTQADLWHMLRDYDIINGDRAGLCKKDDRWKAYGLPYAGSSSIYRNEFADISAIVVLRQGRENRISKVDGSMLIRYLYPEITLHPWDEDYVKTVFDLLHSLVQDVPVYLLECLPDAGAVALLEKTLEEEGML